MNNKHQYQFELWEECNSRCRFCYLGDANLITPDDQKIHNIQIVIDKINDINFFNTVNCLGFIGGEFFQGQLNNNNVKLKFLQLMTLANKLLNDGYIDSIWLSATLMLGDQHDLYECLNCFSTHNLDKIWILTSYDTIGRFHTEKIHQNWLKNLQILRQYSQDIKINITSILTGDFINRYLNDTLDIQQIAQQYNCAMFWKPPCSIDRQNDNHLTKQEINTKINNFFPTRTSFLNFLYKYKSKETDFMYEKLFNMQYRSDYLEKFSTGFHISHRIKSSSIESTDCGTDVLQCGHSSQYQIYIDSNKCAICDKLMIQNII